MGVHLFACLLLFSPKALFSQPVSPLIRNYSPPAWQAADVRWIRDVQPRNKIDDLIDTSADERFDVVVNFKRCVEDRDITMLNHWSPTNRVQRRLKYISSVTVGSLSKPEICAFAASPEVAFIERQFGFTATLNTSVPTICVTAGSASCPGNVAALGFDGTGVNIAIIDTGVDDNHSAFAGGAQFGYNAAASPPVFANPPDDIFHGTHVASIALGRSWVSGATTFRGVAPGAGLIDVKVIGAGDFAALLFRGENRRWASDCL
jgi:subtilisin family serine protease